MSHGSGAERHRQYEHIKESAQERGVGEERAEGIAARTAGGDHFRTGTARAARRTSTADPPSARRTSTTDPSSTCRTSATDPSSARHGGAGAPARGRFPATGPTRDQLYEEARRKNVHGRSTMTKAELARAVGR
ncbi:plasmid stabilization protein [Streptomyces sp. NPDC014685]|uniref:plasmid stabilization protein n=1 Tax=Streptomyces sp. NPDC014685 TaxID=3364881 RepID=UPI003700C619